jgi:hypothetical protein
MDIYDITIVNFLEHVLWQKRGKRLWTRGRRTLQRWRERVTGWREARSAAQHERVARRRAQENARMETQALQRAQVKTVLGQLDESFLEAFIEELYELKQAELYARALAQVREEHQEALEIELGKARDALAKQKDLLAGELEAELDRRSEQMRQEVRDEYDERLATLKERLQEAKVTGERASVLLISLVKQLLSRKRTYLYDAHIEELDVRELNAFLAAHHLHVRGEYRHSERQVKCRLKNGWAQRTVFTLEEAGASEPDGQEDAGALVLPEASADGEASTI